MSLASEFDQTDADTRYSFSVLIHLNYYLDEMWLLESNEGFSGIKHKVIEYLADLYENCNQREEFEKILFGLNGFKTVEGMLLINPIWDQDNLYIASWQAGKSFSNVNQIIHEGKSVLSSLKAEESS